jgi:NAD(P)-dependent dehydrogenase (short-subunit alcohol dehydrogenase family)
MAGIKDLRNKTVVVTGAGSGIGRATAHVFAEHQANLIISDINPERLKNVEGEINAYGVKVTSVPTDVSDRAQVEALSKHAVDTFGKVDVLVNNAGLGWGGPSEVFPLEDFEKLMAVNFWGVIYGVQHFLPMMQKRKSGHIVNVSSSAGLNGLVGLGAYTASKHGIAGYSEVLRAELCRHNIGVTTICPGVINTNIVQDGKSTEIEGMKINQSKMADFYKKWGWPPGRVAKAILKAVQKNKGVVPVGPEAWLLWYFKRLSLPLWQLYLKLSAKLAL